MQNLSFNDGRKSFTVNEDPNRVIRFNPADPEILNRILHLQHRFMNYQPPENIELNPDGSPKSGMEKDAAYIAEFTNVMRGAFNDIFNANVYDIVFDGQSPLCVVNDQYLFMVVLDAFKELLTPAIEEYNAQRQKADAHMKKYLEDL